MNSSDRTPQIPAENKLVSELREAVRGRGLAIRTEQMYADWVARFLGFLCDRTPTQSPDAIRDFLRHLATGPQRGERHPGPGPERHRLFLSARIELNQLRETREIFKGDMAAGCDGVFIPEALARKYPSAPKEWKWQYVFPVQELLGHADVATTMIYTHVLNRGGVGSLSPADSLPMASPGRELS